MTDLPRDRYVRACRLDRVIDGDTVEISIDLGGRLTLTRERLRLFGIDTPEMNDRDPMERARARAATEFVVGWCREAEAAPIDDEWPLIVRTVQARGSSDDWSRGKYGRLLARLYRSDGRELSKALLDAGHARLYLG